MSHLKERDEKVCLNCGTDLVGFYCHDCGQQNIEPKESAWHLIMHFFSDLFHFDGKFFVTMKYLAIKPGFLTEEYVKGRRASYVNPIRMYLFVSAVFFVIFTSYLNSEISKSERKHPKHTEEKTSANKGKIADINDDKEILYRDSTKGLSITRSKRGLKFQQTTTESSDSQNVKSIATVAEYDSIQKTLPENKRDGTVSRYFTRNSIAANEFNKKHPGELKKRFISGFLHSLPYILFVSLPLLALILQLLYVRRKQFYYVGHAIFTVHYFIFYFISFLLIVLFNNLGPVGEVLSSILQIGLFVYLYLAMRRFYKQRRVKTFVKFFFFNFLGFILIILVFIAFGINLFLNIANTH